MPQICVSELVQHWYRWWLVAYSASSYYLNQSWVIVNWTLRNKLQWKFNQNTNIFIQENAYDNIYIVWKMAATLSRPQCVKTSGGYIWLVIKVFFLSGLTGTIVWLNCHWTIVWSNNFPSAVWGIWRNVAPRVCGIIDHLTVSLHSPHNRHLFACRQGCERHRNMTPKTAMPTVASRLDIIIEGVPRILRWKIIPRSSCLVRLLGTIYQSRWNTHQIKLAGEVVGFFRILKALSHLYGQATRAFCVHGFSSSLKKFFGQTDLLQVCVCFPSRMRRTRVSVTSVLRGMPHPGMTRESYVWDTDNIRTLRCAGVWTMW